MHTAVQQTKIYSCTAAVGQAVYVQVAVQIYLEILIFMIQQQDLRGSSKSDKPTAIRTLKGRCCCRCAEKINTIFKCRGNTTAVSR